MLCAAILAFIALLDNYESSTGVAETVTEQEEKENWNFINLVFETEVMKLAHKFLVYKGKVSKDVREFKKQFYDMWFKLYRRSRSSKYVLLLFQLHYNHQSSCSKMWFTHVLPAISSKLEFETLSLIVLQMDL